jgi:DNA replication ATP-dependent helicase Dna2
MSQTDSIDSYKEKISEIGELSELVLPVREKYIALKYILERSCYEFTQDEPLQFPSCFSRLVFLCQKHELSQKLERQLHRLRIKGRFLQKDDKNILYQKDWEAAAHSLKEFFAVIYLNRKEDNESEIDIQQTNAEALPKLLRVQIIRNDIGNKLLTCIPDLEAWGELLVRYDVPGVNDVFTPSAELFWEGAQLNLIDSKKDEANGWIVPQCLVLEPDYLLDVSALAECFPNYGANHLHYFKRKFEQSSLTHYILLGNLANFFLDELIYAENPQQLSFRDTFLKAFKHMPFEFTGCEAILHREDFMAFMVKAESHFEHIRRVVTEDFKKAGIGIKQCTLEPSFFCEKYGFQGRLDLLQPAENEHGLHHIIELKSGGLPYPTSDHARISTNHEVQTVIYRMIIETAFACDNRQIFPAILYSAADIPGTNMRMAAPSRKMEKHILELRNRIVAMEHDLFMEEENGVLSYLKDWLDIGNYPRAPKFVEEQLSDYHKIFSHASPLEMDYFVRFVSFISRELYILKAGDLGPDTKPGISDLWKSEFRQRQTNYELISELSIRDIQEYERGMVIYFTKHQAQPFVNFREGDICVVYPHDSDEDSVLNKQILKGTIAQIDSKEVVVKFRYKQRNEEYFRIHQNWAIEHDVMDHSYNQMFRNLFAFLTSPPEKRDLLLGIRPPKSSFQGIGQEAFSKDEKQEQVIEKAIAASDYFLIVGPPGTGKTSIYARRLIEKYFSKPDTNILILAYTNRAVDELCEAIEAAVGSPEEYIRIGSELSCGAAYRDRLLQNISGKATSRNELLQILQSKRIYVGTLAAILGRQEIFSMKKFQVGIIDEASQILEPQIIGLLPLFDKFILIGDHKQLSTITLQEESKSRVTNPNLNEIGLLNCRDSFFERLFRLCQTRGWTSAYDTLTYQGRMHESLSGFVNTHFYENMLCPANDWQLEKHTLTIRDASNRFQQLIVSHRAAFISSPKEYDLSSSGKVNEQEAELVAFLAKALVEVYQASQIAFEPQKSLGVIAPYRNQIAMIRHKLEMLGIPVLNEIMVDTVERFQGSQRNVIILSFCMNKPSQLQFFCNMNSEKTVDRKLNVALTRARKQLFLIGNKEILKRNPIYKKLIEWMEEEHVCYEAK